MELLLPLINIGVIFFVAWRWWLADDSAFRKIFWPAFFLKLGAGLLLGYIYSYYYTNSDTVSFFQKSVELSELGRNNFPQFLDYLWSATDAPYSGENRTIFFVKIVSLFSFITGDNYWIVSLYFSFLSFLAIWWLTRIISLHFPDFSWSMVFSFLVFPSTVFWSSGVIKETMAFVSLCFLSGIYIKFWVGKKIPVWQYLLVVLFIWILWSLKYYYAALFIPIACTALLTRWFAENRMKASVRSAYRELVLFMVLLMVMFFVVTFVHPNLYPQRVLEVMVENNEIFLELSHPDKVIHFFDLEPTFGSLLLNMPWAFLSGLFRPIIWEASNILQILVSVENLFLGFLVVISLKNLKLIARSEHRILILSILVYCFLLCSFLAISAPNFGTLVRYRVGFLPFFVLLVGYQTAVVGYLKNIFKT